MNKEILEKAIELSEERELRFEDTLSNLYWVAIDGYLTEGDYCKNCIDKAVHDAKQKRTKEKEEVEFGYDHSNLGLESDRFISCDYCGEDLKVNILPNKEELQYMLEDLEKGVIDDRLAWRCNSLLHNAWEDEDHKACNDLTLKLAKRVIEILEK